MFISLRGCVAFIARIPKLSPSLRGVPFAFSEFFMHTMNGSFVLMRVTAYLVMFKILNNSGLYFAYTRLQWQSDKHKAVHGYFEGYGEYRPQAF